MSFLDGYPLCLAIDMQKKEVPVLNTDLEHPKAKKIFCIIGSIIYIIGINRPLAIEILENAEDKDVCERHHLRNLISQKLLQKGFRECQAGEVAQELIVNENEILQGMHQWVAKT